MMVLIALSSIMVEQTKATEKNNGTMHPIIGLPVGPRGRKGPNPRIRHDLKYPLRCLLSFGSKRPQSHMRSFFMGWMPKDGESIRINGAFNVSVTILRFVVASAAKAELGAL
jgi:hypothetical protein